MTWTVFPEKTCYERHIHRSKNGTWPPTYEKTADGFRLLCRFIKSVSESVLGRVFGRVFESVSESVSESVFETAFGSICRRPRHFGSPSRRSRD